MLPVNGAFVFMAGYSFKFKIDISEWRKAAGFAPDSQGDVYAPNAFARKGKIKIASNQPINTKVFEEAIVLEYISNKNCHA